MVFAERPRYLGSSSANQSVVATGRRTWKTLKGKDEVVWPPYIEMALIEGLEQYRPGASATTKILGRFPKRNRFISDHIFNTTGKRRTPKQVGSRIQQLRDTCEDAHIQYLLSRTRYLHADACDHSSISSESSDGPHSLPESPVDGPFITLPQLPGVSDHAPGSNTTSRGSVPSCAYSFADNVSFDVQYNPNSTPLVHLPYPPKPEITGPISADGSALTYYSKPPRSFDNAQVTFATPTAVDGTSWSSEYNYHSSSCYALPPNIRPRINTDVYSTPGPRYTDAVEASHPYPMATSHGFSSPSPVDSFVPLDRATGYDQVYAEPAQHTNTSHYPTWQAAQPATTNYSQGTPDFSPRDSFHSRNGGPIFSGRRDAFDHLQHGHSLSYA